MSIIKYWRLILFAVVLLGWSSTPAIHASPRVRIAAETVLKDPVVRFSAGAEHTCQVKNDGTVNCWGGNRSGQVGDGTTINRLTPVPVSGLSNAVAVAAGARHTCGLLANGTARCWGDNLAGQLGDNTTIDRLTPVIVRGLTNAVAIAAAGTHSCALLSDGTARCWGFNLAGSVGDNTSVRRHTPVTVLAPDGTPLSNIVAITSGREHTCGLIADGTARCWGLNNAGQLGGNFTGLVFVAVTVVTPLNRPLTNIVAIAAGSQHTCALIADGTVHCWGVNNHGQIGDNTTTNRHAAVPVITPPNTPLSNVVAIAAGFSHTCALMADGTARCWGRNSDGEVGDGTFTERLTPVTVNSSPGTPLANVIAIAAGGLATLADTPFEEGHTCALVAAGTARCWGSNSSGQLGNNSFDPEEPTPVNVVGVNTAVAIAAGGEHTCALNVNGAVFCWGFDGQGRSATTCPYKPSVPQWQFPPSR